MGPSNSALHRSGVAQWIWLRPFPLLCTWLVVTLLVQPSSGDPLNVCLIATAGWVNCDANKSSATYTGVDVELFRTAAARAGWQEGVTYQFVCYGQDAGWSALARKLGTNGTLSTCAVGSGSFALTSTRQAMGLQLSYPYYRTGLGVLIATGSRQIDMFAFIKPFTIEVWLAFLVTIILVPMLTWLVEQLMQEGAVILDWDSLYEARQATYTSILAVFNLNVYKVKSLAAQALIITFCFVNLIVMATYVANLAAALTNISMAKRFTDVTDLRGRKVAAHSTYQPTMVSSYGVQSRTLDFDGPSTFDELKAALTNHSLDAYIMDLPEIGYYVMSQNDDCAVRLLPKPYALIDFGYLFHKDFNTSAFTDFNAALFKSLEANYVEQLASKFLLFLGALDRCATASTSDAITFQQLAGLWIILGAAIGLALVACTVSLLVRIFGKSAPVEDRKLSSVFVSGASAKMARSVSRAGSMHGGSVHGGRRASALLSTLGGGSISGAPGDGSVAIKVRPSNVVFPETGSVGTRQMTGGDGSVPGLASPATPREKSGGGGGGGGGLMMSPGSVSMRKSSSQPDLYGTV